MGDGISAIKFEAARLNLLSSLIYPTQLTAHNKHRVSSFSPTEVAYHLQKVSGKSDWKVNRTRLFGSFRRKISGSNGTPEKVVLFFRTESFTEILVPFLESHLWYQFQAFGAVFSVNGTNLCKMWMRFRDEIYQIAYLNFASHFSKPWTDRFAHVNAHGKQPKFSCSMAA